MTKSLRLINQMIANADPNNYDSISYNKYYRDLTNISNTVMEEANAQAAKNKLLIDEILKLENSPMKDTLLKLVNQ